MGDKAIKTKADLYAMLVKAVRNTQPQRSATRNPSRSAERTHDNQRRSARSKSKEFAASHTQKPPRFPSTALTVALRCVAFAWRCGCVET